MVGHAGGKYQSRVIVPIQAIKPGGHTGQEAGSSFGFSVGWQRPAARDSLCPQIHYIQEVVVEKECKHLAKAEQGQVSWVLCFYHPENLKTGKVPLINSEVRAADDVAPVKLQARLKADAAVL